MIPQNIAGVHEIKFTRYLIKYTESKETTESFRLERPGRSLSPVVPPSTARSITVPKCHIHTGFKSLQGKTLPLPWAACSNTWQPFMLRIFFFLISNLNFWWNLRPYTTTTCKKKGKENSDFNGRIPITAWGIQALVIKLEEIY